MMTVSSIAGGTKSPVEDFLSGLPALAIGLLFVFWAIKEANR